MFSQGFSKIAYTSANVSPEEIYDLKAEKDPYQGAVGGALAGAAIGAAKKKTHKAALIGAGIGGAAGASAKYLAGKANKALRLGILKSEISHLNIKSTPKRHRNHEEKKD